MDFDLWLPTANPFTTPALLSAIAGEAEERGIHTIWVGEHVVTFDQYASSYPYSDDGRLPLPGHRTVLPARLQRQPRLQLDSGAGRGRRQA